MNNKHVLLKAQLQKNELEATLRGKCMEPLLQAGDLVMIKKCSSFIKGQLYLFELPNGELAVHRLIGSLDKKALMKGDRSKCFESIPYSNIIGMVFKVNLIDSNQWHYIRSVKKEGSFIALCSQKHAYWGKTKDKQVRERLTKKVASYILIAYGYIVRYYWKVSG